MPRDEEFVADVYSESKKSDAQIERSRKILSKFNKEQRNAVLKASALGGAVAAVSARVITELGNVERATKRFFDNFTMAPLLDGLHEYEEQLASIRTMATNASQFEDDEKAIDRIASATGKVNKAMKQLNEYADLTVYKFSDMTYAAQRFVTAGLTIEDSAAMTQGIGNLVAFLGGDKQAYSTAVEMFSQAMSSGKMMAYQFNSLSRQGLTGEAMQRIFISTAKAMGKDAPEWEELSHMYNADGTLNTDFDNGESFKDSLTDDWLTSDVLRQVFLIMSGLDELGETMLQFKEDGALTDESQIALDQYLSSLGYDKETTEFIENMVVEGQKAATKVKTYSEFIGATQEAIGTGWAAVFQNLLGDYDEASKLWSGLLNEVTGDNGIGYIMGYLEEEFGKLNEKDRANMSAILFNVWTMIKNIAKSIGNLLGVSELKDGALVTKVQKLLENLKGITDILAGNALVDATRPIGKIANFLGMIWGHLKNILGAVKKLTGSALRGVWELLGAMFESLHGPIDTLLTWLEGLIDRIANSEMLKKIGSALKEMVQGLLELSGSKLSSGLSDFFAAFSGVKVTGFGGFVDALVGFFQSLGGMFNGEGNVGSFLGASGKLLLGLIMLVAAFKLIAKVGKSFKGVESNFWTIITTIAAIVIGVKLLNNISVSEASAIFVKTMILAIPIWLFSKAIMKIAKAGEKASNGIAGLLVLFAVIGALIFAVYELAKYGDLDNFDRAVTSIAKLAGGIGLLSFALAALFAAISLLIYVITKGSNSAAGDVITTKLFGATLKINSLGMTLSGIAGVMSALALFIQTIKTVPEFSWKDIGKIGALLGIVTAMMVVIMILAKFMSQGQKAGYWMEKAGAENWTTKKVTRQGSGGSPAGFMLSAAILLISMVGTVALIQKVASTITLGDGTITKMWILAGMMSALFAVIAIVGLVSTKAGYSGLKLLPLVFIIGALYLLVAEIVLLTKAMKDVDQGALNAMWQIIGMISLLLVAMGAAAFLSSGGGSMGVSLMMFTMAIAIGVLALALSKLSDVDAAGLKEIANAMIIFFVGIAAIILIMGVLAAIASVFEVFLAAFIAVGAAIALVGAGVALAGLGVYLFVEALSKLEKAVKSVARISKTDLSKMGDVFDALAIHIGSALGTVLLTSLDSFLSKFSSLAPKIAESIGAVIVESTRVITEQTVTISEYILKGLYLLLVVVKENIGPILDVAFEIGDIIGKSILKGMLRPLIKPIAWILDALGYTAKAFNFAIDWAAYGVDYFFAGLPEEETEWMPTLKPKSWNEYSDFMSDGLFGTADKLRGYVGATELELTGSHASAAISAGTNPASGSASSAAAASGTTSWDEILANISKIKVVMDKETIGRLVNEVLGDSVGNIQ